MSKILIVYDSPRGQTRKICFFISDFLSGKGFDVACYDIREIPSLNLSAYDGVILGAPVHRQKYSKELEEWTRNNMPYFFGKPQAFFSVCLGIMDVHAKVQSEEKEIAHQFLQKTHCHPDQIDIFAGALHFSTYSFPLKILMWWIARKSGAKANIFRDQEFTNWDQVKTFARKFSQNMKVEEDCTRMTAF